MNPASARRTLFDRDSILTCVLSAVAAPDSPPLILVSGPMGIGRSAVLTAVGDNLAGRGIATLMLRVRRTEQDRAFSLAARLTMELGAPLGGGDEGRSTGPTTSQESPSAITGRLAGVFAAARTTDRQLVVLIDDIQWIDSESLDSLVPLLPTLANTSLKVVGALRLPGNEPDGAAALRQLRDAGLVTVLPLRPLSQAAVNSLVTHELQARPSAPLAETLRRTCRGVPGAVLAALASYRDAGWLRVVDRYAYLTVPNRPPQLAGQRPLFEDLRRLGEPAWSVATALAVLHQLGRAAPRLIAQALEISEDGVCAALGALRAEGLVQLMPNQGRWRFRLPLMTAALTACLGAYERRRLAQVAVTAIWAGEATAGDIYLAEQLVDAGRFVDPRRSGVELLARGAAAMLDNGYFAERWLRAAIDRIVDPAQRAEALFLHASTCCIHQRFDDAVDSSWTVLSEYADLIPPEALLELEMIYVIALAGSMDMTALRNIADEGWRSLPGSAGHRVLARFSALCHLDRWRDADEHLRPTRPMWRHDSTLAGQGLIYGHTTAAFLGRKKEFDRLVDDPTGWPLWSNLRARFELLSGLVRILNAFGELDRVRQLLATYELPASHRYAPDQVVADSLAGHWDAALDRARMSLATESSLGYPPAYMLMCREISTICIARGRLTQARSMIETARTRQPVLTHLLASSDADLELVVNAHERARQAVVDGLVTATRGGVVIGTDELWLRLASWEALGGDHAEAARCAAEASRVADLIETGRARLCALLATAVSRRDSSAAAEAIRLARRRGQPYELARCLVELCHHRVVDDSQLREAYELYGELDALLARARLRGLMRERGVSVPGRNVTVAENEELLATLVTDGLTNRELAMVLGASEKSVEGRLTRLFQRTGYQSRVELAWAVLTGEYEA
jgi:DNA-binding CsgD family transcriptional regulator